MADGTVYETDQIIDLDPTDELTRERMAVESIIFTGTAAGSFVFVFGNAALTITTGANDLTKQIDFNRSVNYVKLTSGPAGAKAYVLLEKKR